MMQKTLTKGRLSATTTERATKPHSGRNSNKEIVNLWWLKFFCQWYM